MNDTLKNNLLMHASDKLLALMPCPNEYTNSDWQGVIEAVCLTLINDTIKTLE